MLRASTGWFPWNLLGSRMVLLVMAITRRATVALLVALVGGCTASRGTAPHESQGLGSSASVAAPSPHQEPWARLEARPFHIPSVHSGASCPKTTRGLHAQQIRQISSVLRSTGPRIALGSGPVYPFFFFGGAFYRPNKTSGKGSAIRPANHPGAWDSIKTLWIAPRSFEGRVLVRGRQINGLHRLRFGAGNRSGLPFLRLSRDDAAVQRDGSSHWTGGTWVSAPGCYALQLDDSHASKTIVIEIGRTQNV